jgi:hypothetical protein
MLDPKQTDPTFSLFSSRRCMEREESVTSRAGAGLGPSNASRPETKMNRNSRGNKKRKEEDGQKGVSSAATGGAA